jgi:hypothetical protein
MEEYKNYESICPHRELFKAFFADLTVADGGMSECLIISAVDL